ncbi:haloacid dehalogenase-like hydrolase domain-containing protein At2g33255 [Camellia sinensis]|uniref:haloacid dehalogenase-like hydrolase domain-containing protein At2g33255 n=1 Tax=Camellia sinensis TaxID=4442 RepID=UPI0010361253|nr:haloacid dehalogenase-like hydrolase domain-containing protein At2g33255 [Camellia sinensis]
MMVGDNLKDDVSSALFLSPSFAPYLLRTFLIHFEVACGKRAGAFTCLLDKTGRYDSPEYIDVEFKPDYKEDAKLLILFSCSWYCNTVRA